MFLSQLCLNRRKPDVLRDLASPYEMHRTLMRSFPDSNSGGPGRVLYRVELSRDEDRPPTVLVQSACEPDWRPLQRDGYADISGPKRLSFVPGGQTERNPDDVPIQTDDRFRFRLLANPTVKRRVLGKKHGRRDACVTEEQQQAWLIRKGAKGGFALAKIENDDEEGVFNVSVVPLGKVRSFRRRDRMTLSHHAVRFDGVLQVTDPARFGQTIESGIGSAKAFGYGLLSVAPK